MVVFWPTFQIAWPQPVPPNGSVDYTETTYTMNATYSCDQGFTLTGSQLVMCRSNSTWEPAPHFVSSKVISYIYPYSPSYEQSELLLHFFSKSLFLWGWFGGV